MTRPALGLIETAGLTGAIQATHAATKAGEVAIASAERTASGHITVKIEGEWAAVQAAVEAGARAADQAGELISMHVIPRTDNGVLDLLPYRRFLARYQPEDAGSVPAVLTPAAKPKPKPAKKKARPAPKPPEPTPLPVEQEAAPDFPPDQVPEPVEAARPPIPAPERPTPPAATPQPAPQPVPQPTPQPAAPVEGEPSLAELEALPVVKLRQYARTVKGLPIQGRQISMANKQQLLEAIRSVRGEL